MAVQKVRLMAGLWVVSKAAMWVVASVALTAVLRVGSWVASLDKMTADS